MGKIVTRIHHSRGFRFVYEGSGRTLRSKRVRDYIDSLVIPPAWKNVHVDLDKKAKVHAWGRDGKGRKQYIYNESWRAENESEKFDRIVVFAKLLPRMRRVTGQHLRRKSLNREKALACMIRLMDQAYFRPGSDSYTEENRSYGLTTLRSKHLTIAGAQLEFRYRGKSGIQQDRVIKDPILAKVVRQMDEIPGYQIFQYYDENHRKVDVDADMLNDYLREIMGGDFTCKDFRTWAGTYLAAEALDKLGVEDSATIRKKKLNEAIDTVAKKLGNTRSVARSSYIDPRVLEHYEQGRTIREYVRETVQNLDRKNALSREEQAVVALLKAQLRRKRLKS